MKSSNLVSSAVLLFNALLFLILGAGVWSGPEAFAGELGLLPAAPSTIDRLAVLHGGSFFALSMLAGAAAFLPVLVRWFALLALTLLAVAAWTWLWSFAAQDQGRYAALLYGLFAINVLTLATGFLGEPLFEHDHSDDDHAHARWG